MSSTRLRYLSTQPPVGGTIWGGAGALKKEVYYQEWTLRDQSLAILPVSSLHLLLEVNMAAQFPVPATMPGTCCHV